jgi:hypothetical protein
MTEKERIGNILKSEPTDRIGILDLDIEIYSKKSQKESEKFFLYSFDGLFQSLSSELGLEEALVRFVQEPRHVLSYFLKRHKEIIADYKRLKDAGYRFDGVWMGEDIAYDEGLYFSLERYQRQLSDFHKDICSYFKAEDLAVFLHCDGRIEDLIPRLTVMGVAAIHPVQERCNPNLLEIKKDLKENITFIGGVGLVRFQEGIERLKERVSRLKDGGNYIFSFDGPLPDDIDKKRYNSLLEDIKVFGAYR